MKDIIPAKKQSPILGLTGMGGGVGSNIVAGLAKKTYSDEVFSTYLYRGTNGANTANTGLDMSGEGGLIWIKARGSTTDYTLFDTTRGANKKIRSDTNNSESDMPGANQTFTSTGFTLNNTYTDLNDHNVDYVSWNLRKAKGFFDIVTWTGNGSTRTIDHNLGCLPGCIMVKNLTNARDWTVWHRGAVESNASNTLILNTEAQAATNSSYFDNGSTPPTATNFTVHGSNRVNLSGDNYIAYVYAGGRDLTTATAKSVDFDGTNDYLSIADHADFDVGTNWTVECWFNCDALTGNGWDALFGQWTGSGDNGYLIEYVGTELRFYLNGMNPHKVIGSPSLGQWHHVAISKEGSTTRIFLNGIQTVDDFDMGTLSIATSAFTVGGNVAGGGWFNGKISNLRIVKGTAVYTSAFRPPTKPLTNITNTVLLCCNDSSQTGSTVTPGTITNNGSTASTYSPFDDPDNFIFGEDADQNMVKCGSYDGNNSSDGPIINLGWEPAWVMIKRTAGGSGDWVVFDNMRGLSTAGLTDSFLLPNENNPEVTNLNCVDISATGFELKSSDTRWNGPSSTYVYMAIRRSDGYVGKPVEAGTEVYSTVYGNAAGTNPSFVTNFVVDYALNRTITGSESWYSTSRLTRSKYMVTNDYSSETDASTFKFDHSNGWRTGGAVAAYLSWNWKRHAGFDVVGYTGNGSAGREIPHSLSKSPEMIWVKGRGPDVANWYVYHNAVGNQKALHLETSDRETSAGVGHWNGTDPTSTHFSIGINPNTTNNNYLAILFASVDGISKVGSFAGSSSDVTLNLGFVPRFLMVKGRTGPSGTNWVVWDNVRGITGNYSSGGADTPRMYLNAQSASSAGANDNVFTVDSGGVKGITIVTGPTWNNHQDYNYIYYAHA